MGTGSLWEGEVPALVPGHPHPHPEHAGMGVLVPGGERRGVAALQRVQIHGSEVVSTARSVSGGGRDELSRDTF